MVAADFVFRAGLSKLRVRVQAFLAQILDIYSVAGTKMIQILVNLQLNGNIANNCLKYKTAKTPNRLLVIDCGVHHICCHRHSLSMGI